MENEAESQNLTLSGGALSLGISGLNPNTSYMVGLYGMYRDSVLEPLYTVATTGTPEATGAFFSPILSCSSSASSGGTAPDLQRLSACSKSARTQANVPVATSLPAPPRLLSALQPLSASQLREGAVMMLASLSKNKRPL